jgi:hypothetical protein
MAVWDRHSNARDSAAAPPLYLLVIVLIPIAAAIYIASTRFTDNKHAGFDILFGSIEGLICAWFAVRLYHPPISVAGGWAWAPRHRTAAFGVGTGVGSFANGGLKGKRKIDGVDVEGGIQRRPGDESVELQNLGRTDTAEGSYRSDRPLRP